MADSLDNLRERIYGVVERGVVLLSTATTKLQALQLQIAGEATDDDLEHFEPYGLTSRPRDPDSNGSPEALAVSLGGNRDHQIVVCVVDRRFRITGLDKGEVVVYNFTGANLKLDDDGNLIATPKSGEEVLLGGSGATKEVARKGDSTACNATIDASLFAWFLQVATATFTTAPTSITCQIDEGSSVVKAVD